MRRHFLAMTCMGCLVWAQACAPGTERPDEAIEALPLPAEARPAPESQPAPSSVARDTPTTALAARPAEDVARDAKRKPEQVLDFLGIEQGDRVVDVMTGTGYYADVLLRRVGPEGDVVALNNGMLDSFMGQALRARAAGLGAPNFHVTTLELDAAFEAGEELDAVMLVRLYHDLTYFEGVDRAAMNEAIFKGLKPGGVYAIIDYSAAAGRGSQDAKTLHRVESALVKREVEAAGFVLAASSDVLRVPGDDLATTAFGRGDDADRYVLKFVKPAP